MGATLVLAPGSQLSLSDGVSIEILGRLYAVGTELEPIAIGAPASERYLEIAVRAGPNQIVNAAISSAVRGLAVSHQTEATTLVESVSFDSWQDVAIREQDSSGLTVTNSRFGFETPDAEVSGETIRSLGSGGIVIRDSEFSYRRGYRDVLDLQDCDPNDWPIVIGNRFDGGEDDAVDLDQAQRLSSRTT